MKEKPLTERICGDGGTPLLFSNPTVWDTVSAIQANQFTGELPLEQIASHLYHLSL
jgi:hypothetical protein